MHARRLPVALISTCPHHHLKTKFSCEVYIVQMEVLLQLWWRGIACRPLEQAGQGDLGFLQGEALPHTRTRALPESHPAAGNLLVERGLLRGSLHPALGDELQRL